MERNMWEIREYESLDSTNLEARRLLTDGSAGVGLVVWAHHQTAGRGRLDRAWYDARGKSLLISLGLPALDPFRAAVLASTSMHAALIALGASGPNFKWPNDLVYGKRKVGGILSETCRVGGGAYLITGVGLNVSYEANELPIDSRLPATSLLIEEGKKWEIPDVLDRFLGQFELSLAGDWESSLAGYRHHLAYAGEKVRVEKGYSLAGGVASGDELVAVLEGVDEAGHLLLRTEGETHKLVSGDITPI
jgi:BirA family transcriptional regulator, biotin operon repressor / biotin---[acetyl-CoA-carboxylase] ligase